uniref:Cytochrome P450, family 27, subfamily B, polypeptide 1 n=1 Tax=Lepisosteus oculatus TaxID=7918 RepID=W5M8C5_LEPOC
PPKKMLQALKGSARSASPVVRWLDSVWESRVSLPRQDRALKTLQEMPGPSGFSFAWDLFARGGLSRLHELQVEGRARYGPVWKASFGPILTVHVAEPALIEQVLRQEGQHPIRSDLSSWKDYRQLRGHAYGLLTAEGEEWQAIRSLLGKHMLRPRAVEAYSDTLNSVVTDLIAKLQFSRRQNAQGVVKDVASEFYRFGLEGISSVLFESRIGCLEPQVPPETERFIQAINTMFVMTLLTMAMPRWLHRLFPKPWRTFCQCWDYMFEFGPGPVQSWPTWLLVALVLMPEVQSALRREVEGVLGGREVPGAVDVAQMPLMKAVVKEVLRLYPVIPANARVIADRDIQVGGYLIPKKTLITLCHFATSRDPRFFSSPARFWPERWLSREEGHHPYASVPFGVGKRSCIGRRIAELELYLALARILTRFEVKPDPEGGEVRPMTRTLLVPQSHISLQFIER